MRKIMNLFNRSKCQNPLERFSVTMLSEMINDDKNLLISPCRLMSLLSFLYGYSSEESKRRIEMLLGIDFKNTEQVHNSMSQSVILPTENYESWVRDDEKQLLKATICSSLWIDPYPSHVKELIFSPELSFITAEKEPQMLTASLFSFEYTFSKNSGCIILSESNKTI